MTLSSAIGSAVSGLNASQVGLDLVSRNIANANTPGYTAKTANVQDNIAGGVGIGVQILAATRNVDSFLQQQLNTENASTAKMGVVNDFLGRVVQMFGTPDSNSSVAASVTSLITNLQAVATTPDDSAARQTFLNSAGNLASQLNSMSAQIQTMRSQAETNIAAGVDQANTALQTIAKLNSQIAQGTASGQSVADLQDQRDTAVSTLSTLMGVKTLTHDDGTIAIFTTGGQLLLDKTPMKLSFDQHTNLDATSSYSTDPTKRTVGTITLQNGTNSIDLLASGAIRSGSIAGYVSMRDTVLTQAQGQLDELASKLALSMSTDKVAGTAATATVGTGTGFNVDVSSFLAGNTTGATGTSINFSFTNASGAQNVSVVPVSDPSLLPLPNANSAPGNTVLGVYVDPNASASTQMGAIVTAIQTAYPGLAVTNPSGNTLQILDDGTGTSSVKAASATVVENASTMNNGVGTGLSLFVDGSGQKTFTGALGNPPQTLGFAARIQVNAKVQADSTNLVVYQTNPTTLIGDDTRPNDLLSRLTDPTRTYSAATGIGSTGTPYAGALDAFARQIVSYQSTQSTNASANYTSQKVVSDSLQSKSDSASGVSIDTEMSNLIVLQNAYSANARVISTVKNLFDVLLSIGR